MDTENVVPIRARLEALDGGLTDEAAETHFEVNLDDDADTGTTPRGPVVVDQPEEAQVKPIIPLNLRGWRNLRSTVIWHGQRTGHRTAYHTVRSPWYLLQAMFWSLVGLVKVQRWLIWTWWFQPEKVAAAAECWSNGDQHTAMKINKEIAQARKGRAVSVAVELTAVVTLPLWLMLRAWPISMLPSPWSVAVEISIGLLVVSLLAHWGHPAALPIIQPAIVAPHLRKLNSDIVLKALMVAGLHFPDKADDDYHAKFLSTMSRDGKNRGSQVLMRLPSGKTLGDAMKARDKIASGLDITVRQVFMSRDKNSERRVNFYVADRDPLALPAGRSPLLDCKQRDIWKAVHFGLDERGEKVLIDLLWRSVLVGAQPGKGKTFAARLFALHAALDPYVKLLIADGKDSPDWRKFVLVADRIVFGTQALAGDPDPIEGLLEALRYVRGHIDQASRFLSRLSAQECPDGKLTRELSHKYPNLRVHLLVVEEFQAYFELADDEAAGEIAQLLSDIQSLGRAVGVILLSCSQKPSGIGGSPNVRRLFNRYRDNHQVRFALKCGSWRVSEAILGGEAQAEGFDASTLPVEDEYRGVGYLYGFSSAVPTVRTYLADASDAERILHAARKHREGLGLLTGQAAGQSFEREETRDVLADVLSVFAGANNLSYPALAERLREAYPAFYPEATKDTISAQLRALGVPGKPVRDSDYFPNGVGQGCARTEVESAANGSTAAVVS